MGSWNGAVSFLLPPHCSDITDSRYLVKGKHLKDVTEVVMTIIVLTIII